MPISADTYAVLADVSAAFSPPPPADLDDESLLQAQRVLAEIDRRVKASAALVAAEIARRSRPELGYSGLAQSRGARTPEALVQQLTGFTSREARTLARVGTLITSSSHDGDPTQTPNLTPWLRSVADAVTEGRLTLEAADAIRTGLGTPDDALTPEMLEMAAEALVTAAADLTVEKLAALARELRNGLDVDRVAQRENALRDQEYLRIVDLGTGLSRIDGILATEKAARARVLFDAATSPRLGGPRFTDEAAQDRAEQLIADERTTGQIALDTFFQLLELGASTNPTKLLVGRRAPVQVLVTDHDLRARRGFATIEGQTDAVSIHTAERFICADGYLPILMKDGQVVNLGRDSRLFTRFQKMGIATRDGTCIVPSCDRPPSWCEVHHINEWVRDRGRTDIADGVLLCKHHHLMVHNNGWRVIREGAANYYLVPPSSVDPLQRPILCPSTSPAMRRMLSHQRELASAGG